MPEIQTLCQNLSADENVRPLMDKIRHGAVDFLLVLRRVQVEPRHLVFRKHLLHHFFHLLGAHAPVPNMRASAFRTFLRQRKFLPAVVTHRRILPLVVGQGNPAIVALIAGSALHALNLRRVSPPVQEQDHLLPLLQAVPHLPLQPQADHLIPPPGHLSSNVLDFHIRQTAFSHPVLQFNQMINSDRCTVKRNHAWRRASENHRGTEGPRSLIRHVHGFVFRIVVGFVSGLVFLIDDHQSQIRDRCKNRRPGTQNHLGRPLSNPKPVFQPLRSGQLAVQDGHVLRTETVLKPLLHLHGQSDFRHQHDGTSALGQRMLHRMHVNFRLPASGHALQQEHVFLSLI